MYLIILLYEISVNVKIHKNRNKLHITLYVTNISKRNSQDNSKKISLFVTNDTTNMYALFGNFLRCF